MHALGMSKSSFFGLHLVPTAAVLKVGSRLPVAALSNAQGWLKAACSSLEPAWLKAACSNPEPFAQGCAGPSHEISSTVDSSPFWAAWGATKFGAPLRGLCSFLDRKFEKSDR